MNKLNEEIVNIDNSLAEIAKNILQSEQKSNIEEETSFESLTLGKYSDILIEEINLLEKLDSLPEQLSLPIIEEKELPNKIVMEELLLLPLKKKNGLSDQTVRQLFIFSIFIVLSSYILLSGITGLNRLSCIVNFILQLI